MPTLKHLQALCQVEEKGSFSAAAGAVFEQLAAAEAEIGAILELDAGRLRLGTSLASAPGSTCTPG